MTPRYKYTTVIMSDMVYTLVEGQSPAFVEAKEIVWMGRWQLMTAEIKYDGGNRTVMCYFLVQSIMSCTLWERNHVFPTFVTNLSPILVKMTHGSTHSSSASTFLNLMQVFCSRFSITWFKRCNINWAMCKKLHKNDLIFFYNCTLYISQIIYTCWFTRNEVYITNPCIYTELFEHPPVAQEIRSSVD